VPTEGRSVAQARTLGNYEILDELGQGGMGTVYRARDLVLERIVAVKLLHPHAPASAGGGSRFLNEARAIARLSHPAIVAVYEFSDADPGSVYIAMEYVDGMTIEEYVRRIEGEDIAPTLDLIGQLLAGLGYAHERGVVHRDIKPSNLLVTREGRLKITDFGIAKLDAVKHTQTGIMIGTPAYMAPERYAGGGIDPRCDVYSVGVLCYELLTGRRPFGGELTEMIYKICHAPPAAVTTLRPALPGMLDPIIAKALEKDPSARYQTAQEFGAALYTVQEDLGWSAGRGNRREAYAAKSPASFVSATRATAPVTNPQPPAGTKPTSDATPGSDATPAPGLDRASERSAQTPVSWSAGDIAEIVRQLTPILGPLAKITVKRAAEQTRDRAELYQILARELRSDDERKRFLASAPRAARGDSGPVPSAVPKPINSALDSTHDSIAPATLERATKILARYIGPIAVVIVKKTAASATDESDLYARLAGRIADERERARCVADLTRAF
jgi:serine/threonine protein kinase